jgi:hypothetical protein
MTLTRVFFFLSRGYVWTSKGKMFLLHAMKAYGRLQIHLHSFLARAVDWAAVSADNHTSYSFNRRSTLRPEAPKFRSYRLFQTPSGVLRKFRNCSLQIDKPAVITLVLCVHFMHCALQDICHKWISY